MNSLKPSFYARNTVIVAQELLGKQLIRIVDGIPLIGIIIETEAYGHADDPASHAYARSLQLLKNKKISEHNARQSMFGPVGHAYVYFVYGNHFCFNVVAREEGALAGAVLIRGLMPVTGIEIMKHNRMQCDYKNLTNGPGKLTQAFGITKVDDGIKLAEKNGLYIAESGALESKDIIATSRIGISKGQDKLWRFVCREES